MEATLEGVQALIIETFTPIEKRSERELSQLLSKVLVDNEMGYFMHMGIYNGGENLYEGVIVDSRIHKPFMQFTFDWDTNEFTLLPTNFR
jgi:hypothetical protein